jgi:2-methylisocitrate lyase-like PEP mutase family enzyme
MNSYETFLALHHRDTPLLIPNPWDRGSARVLAGLGFAALATTSGGFAATIGVQDGGVTRAQALEHAAAISSAVEVPVSADLENGFADDPDAVAATVLDAAGTGLSGCSIEDYTRDPAEPIYPHGLAVERVAAAVEAAHRGPVELVLTARAENYLHGRADLDDTIRRLQDYAAAGADVVYAPGLTDAGEIASVVQAVDKPVNVLLLRGGPGIAELAELGVRRISVGGALAAISLAALVDSAAEFRSGGSGFLDGVRTGREAMSRYFPAS